MGTKTTAGVRPEIPLQNDGRTELQELAAALSQHVDQRHRTRGSHALEVGTEPETYDLTIESELEPLPVRRPDSRSTVMRRRVRRVVPLALAGILTATVSVAGWTAAHSSPVPQQKTARQQPAATTQPPTTPAEWGIAAHQRLTSGGRPVDQFGCQSAYAADAALAAGTLPPAATSPAIWQAYLAACLSDMSGASARRSG